MGFFLDFSRKAKPGNNDDLQNHRLRYSLFSARVVPGEMKQETQTLIVNVLVFINHLVTG